MPAGSLWCNASLRIHRRSPADDAADLSWQALSANKPQHLEKTTSKAFAAAVNELSSCKIGLLAAELCRRGASRHRHTSVCKRVQKPALKEEVPSCARASTVLNPNTICDRCRSASPAACFCSTSYASKRLLSADCAAASTMPTETEPNKLGKLRSAPAHVEFLPQHHEARTVAK